MRIGWLPKLTCRRRRSIEKREKYHMIVKDHPEGDVYTQAKEHGKGSP